MNSIMILSYLYQQKKNLHHKIQQKKPYFPGLFINNPDD